MKDQMKTNSNNKHHDPESWQSVASHDWDELYKTADGEFVLQEFLRYLNGRKLAPDEKPTDATRDQWRKDFRTDTRLVPMTPSEAMTWCIKTQIPECFRDDLLTRIQA